MLENNQTRETTAMHASVSVNFSYIEYGNSKANKSFVGDPNVI